jgi:hypothetical protein
MIKESDDLTRWNRASLSRFRYINGNAVTFLEDLRKAFAGDDRLSHWLAVNLFPETQDAATQAAFPRWQSEVQAPETESESELIDRLSEQYHSERGDWAWEIARVFARACHILSEYLNAYANEGYIGTATQWDNVRKLTELLDFHPAPPASASTPLVIHAKEDKSGTLSSGFQVKYSPPEGGESVIFETLEDIDVDYDLNKIQSAGWNLSQDDVSGNVLVIEEEVKDLKTGEPIIIEDEKNSEYYGHIIQGSRKVDDGTEIVVSPILPANLKAGYIKIHAKPKDRLSPYGPEAESWPNLTTILRLTEEPAELFAGMVVYITDGYNSFYRTIESIDEKELTFRDDDSSNNEAIDYSKTRVSRPISISVCERVLDEGIYKYKVAGDWSHLTDKTIAYSEDTTLAPSTVIKAEYYPPECSNEDYAGYTLLTILPDPIGSQVTAGEPSNFYVPPPTEGGEWQADTYLKQAGARLTSDPLVTSKPKKTTAGDFAAVVMGHNIAWAKLASVTIDPEKDQASLTADDSWSDNGLEDLYLTDTTVYAHFSESSLRLYEWQKNTTSLETNTIPLKSVPTSLQKGSRVIIERSDDSSTVIDTSILKIEENNLILIQSLPEGFTHGNTVISANIVLAGHGKTEGGKTLGSGDATLSQQSFILDEKYVSFVADSTQSSGVRAAIDIKVSDRTWKQVSNFNYSGPTDPHYIVHITEDETLKVIFGDGTKGRRLPTGTNNVKVTYRKGTGIKGNLDAGSLVKAVKPHHLIDAVKQPLKSTGGNDMEGIDSIRENAPATVLTLERAVSLNDFTYLATSHSSVWQAQAFRRPTEIGRNEKVEVVIVPAGGGKMGDLEGTIVDFLTSHAVPGVDISVEDFDDDATFDLDVIITVDTEQYNPEDIVADVKAALEQEFSLKNRKLGQDVFLSEVYNIVENITGVTHSSVIINNNSSIKRVETEEKEVRILGTCDVDYTGSPTLEAEEIIPTPVVSIPPVRLSVDQRLVIDIQGAGEEYSATLNRFGISTIRDLADLDPATTATGIHTIKIWELKTKAGIILGEDFKKEELTSLLDYSLVRILRTSDTGLAQISGQSVEFTKELKSKIRRVQIAFDEGVINEIRLRELVEVKS